MGHFATTQHNTKFIDTPQSGLFTDKGLKIQIYILKMFSTKIKEAKC